MNGHNHRKQGQYPRREISGKDGPHHEPGVQRRDGAPNHSTDYRTQYRQHHRRIRKRRTGRMRLLRMMRRWKRGNLGRYRRSRHRRPIRHEHHQYRQHLRCRRRRSGRRRSVCRWRRIRSRRKRRGRIPDDHYPDRRTVRRVLSGLRRKLMNLRPSLSQRMRCRKWNGLRMSRLIRHHPQRKSRHLQRGDGHGERVVYRSHLALGNEMTRRRLTR